MSPPRQMTVPIVFVPDGEAAPADWSAAHPGAVRFPATFHPHGVAAPADGHAANAGTVRFPATLKVRGHGDGSGRDSPTAQGLTEGDMLSRAASTYAMPTMSEAAREPPPDQPACNGSPPGAVTRHTIRTGMSAKSSPPLPGLAGDAQRLAAAAALDTGKKARRENLARVADSLSLSNLQRMAKDGLALRATTGQVPRATRAAD